jgi:hypothetical protein
MRVFIGIVLGCVLTILVVYLHDVTAGSNAANAPSATSGAIVNWDVAAGEWGRLQKGVRVAWDKLTGTIDRART